ncbi:fructosamine kinase family protein [Aequorivita xiaoshiensis]|uniref:Fructosamine kinase family protein n=1 Tax=Aequorivita xiaoshiensis TaxID=2874476 RepID=A0A9X1UBG9_9FLAO|nr:fructosamine kinase family protein [Aequorivita xiaoshiensis]MCG2429571.1 fructosamine kinase family protein [Aequorivita xiaoshiensis]
MAIFISRFQNITAQNNLTLIEVKQLFGGDINEVFQLKCKEGNFVVKLNDSTKFPKMFTAEAKGLNYLSSSNSFKIPKVLANGEIENTSYLLIEYISSGEPNAGFWESFADNLVKLHQVTQTNFGLDHDNYIGSLPQRNNFSKSASEFYISNRLEPQFNMASENGFQFKKVASFYKNISKIIPNEAPSLIHGDLWSGNYMVSKENQAVLIDPAVAFAPREMDIAMMKLFGGFSEELIINYNSIFPLEKGWEDRVSLWQLYYLLVHLNLFGRSYLPKVNSVLNKYS